MKERATSHVIHQGLTEFTQGRLVDLSVVPGLTQAGWSLNILNSVRNSSREEGNLKTQLHQLVKRVSTHRSAWPFHEPVDTTIVTDYLDIVKDPIDLSLIMKRVKTGDYYTSKQMLRADLERMCSNCLSYNSPDTNYYK